jgi:hypothetical protein
VNLRISAGRDAVDGAVQLVFHLDGEKMIEAIVEGSASGGRNGMKAEGRRRLARL